MYEFKQHQHNFAAHSTGYIKHTVYYNVYINDLWHVTAVTAYNQQNTIPYPPIWFYFGKPELVILETDRIRCFYTRG